MTLEEIKTEWKRYDKKIAATQRLNGQLILSMLRERSRSRVATIMRNNRIYMGLMIINLVLLAAIFAGNPFDFKYTLQYFPYGIITMGVLLAILSLIKSMRSFTININTVNLDAFLRKTLQEYEKNKKIERWFGIMIFSGGITTALSFLPQKLEHKALLPALGETALSISITLVVYLLAFKAGAFKNRNKDAFESDLKEWNDLKQISSDLSHN
jgi:hypothetical protein